MQGYIGADPVALEALGHQLFSHAEWLDALGVRLSANLYDSTWVGPDAEQMWAEWEEVRLPALGVVVVVLRDMGARVQEQARQQTEASQADGATGPGGGGAGGGGGGSWGDDGGGGWNWLSIVSTGVSVIDLGVDIADLARVPMPGWLTVAGKGLGAAGVILGGFQLGGYIADGDAGGVILQGASVVLGVAALAATGPVAIVALGAAALGFGIAANFPEVREWVGNRWDEVWAGGSQVIDTVTDGAREILDAGEDLVGDFVDVAGDASDAIGGFASDALGAAGDAFGAIGGLF